MKKFKQILCPLLAVTIVFGVTVAGAGAAQNFSDADQIVHVEAVNRAAELGYFVGSGGKFMPKDTVTRAQMATVIVKMLHGSDFNANPYKNMGRFPDTTNYQGGWADGYINLCAQDGVVGGYGDGTFQPNNKVTAAEAVTMLLNALKVDAGKGSWPETVMNKGTELGLFAELTGVQAGTALNRDQLAALVIAGVDWKEEQAQQPSDSGSSGDSSDSGKDDTTAPGGENETERDDAVTPGGENETERDDAATPGGENETERDDAATPGGENETERDDAVTPGGENETERDM